MEPVELLRGQLHYWMYSAGGNCLTLPPPVIILPDWYSKNKLHNGYIKYIILRERASGCVLGCISCDSCLYDAKFDADFKAESCQIWQDCFGKLKEMKKGYHQSENRQQGWCYFKDIYAACSRDIYWIYQNANQLAPTCPVSLTNNQDKLIKYLEKEIVFLTKQKIIAILDMCILWFQFSLCHGTKTSQTASLTWRNSPVYNVKHQKCSVGNHRYFLRWAFL